LPCLRELHPGICLTTEVKAWEKLSQGKENLNQSTVYTLPKHPHITKLTDTHTHTHTHSHTHTHTHTYTYTHTHTHYKTHTYTHTHTHILQNNIKPPQYKLKQTRYKIFVNFEMTIHRKMCLFCDTRYVLCLPYCLTSNRYYKHN
jgi:ABC-type Zn2+ transport system substrate-binding protein/surface adhesin